MAQLDDLLAGIDVILDDEVLDRIDEIVAGRAELNPADNYYADPPLDRQAPAPPHLSHPQAA